MRNVNDMNIQSVMLVETVSAALDPVAPIVTKKLISFRQQDNSWTQSRNQKRKKNTKSNDNSGEQERWRCVTVSKGRVRNCSAIFTAAHQYMHCGKYHPSRLEICSLQGCT